MLLSAAHAILSASAQRLLVLDDEQRRRDASLIPTAPGPLPTQGSRDAERKKHRAQDDQSGDVHHFTLANMRVYAPSAMLVICSTVSPDSSISSSISPDASA